MIFGSFHNDKIVGEFNSIQFNLFSIKTANTFKKNRQDGGDATKSKSLKDVAPPLQLKNNNKKANIKQRQAKHLISMYM